MSAVATAPRPRARASLHAGWAVAAGAVVVLAAALRLWALHRVPGNIFYDAAVRSMGVSWHNLFFGALEPAGGVSIDKPPVDLWLQVATTKAIAFSLTSLHLPEALAGIAAVGALGETVRRLQGWTAGLAAALFLAVLPASVLTSRSDTMDSLLALLLIVALAMSCRALLSGRWRWAMAAAAVMGLAFEVKLTESLVALPAIALLLWWAAPRRPLRRAGALAAAVGAYVLVALSWTIAVALTPLSQRPFPIGSGTGSVWRLLFVYNGTQRLSGGGAIGSAARAPGGSPGPLRLLAGGSAQWGTLIGLELASALLLGAVALTLHVRARPGGPLSPRERIVVALGVWLLCGLVLFSAMTRLQPRYLEAFAPAVAAVAGISLARLLSRSRLAVAVCGAAIALLAVAVQGSLDGWIALGLVGGALACALAAPAVRPMIGARIWPLAGAAAVAMLAACLGWSIRVVRSHTSDSFLLDRSSVALSDYLVAHRDGARYEVAGERVLDLTGFIVHDGLPVLVINDLHAPIIHLQRLQAIVAAGEVRFIYLPSVCRGPHCPGSQPWVLAHSTPVPGKPGLRRFTRA